MNQALENILNRRSMRAYESRQIEEQMLELILRAGLCAPTGKNRQGVIFTVLQGEKLEILGTAVRAALKSAQPPADVPDDYCCYYHAPMLIIATVDRDNPLGACDCACALENMMLAASSLGLASCWINQVRPTCDDARVRQLFTSYGIPENHIAFGSVALGYADGEPRNIEIQPGRVLRP